MLQTHPLPASIAPLSQYFSQLGYVTDDIDRAIEMFAGLGVSEFKRAHGGGDQYQTENGETLSATSILVAFGQLATFEVEIIQPLSAGNLYTDFLGRGGPGLHHIGFSIPDYQEYRAQYQQMLEKGAVPLHGRRIEGGAFNVEFCYFDCSAIGGPIVELTHFF